MEYEYVTEGEEYPDGAVSFESSWTPLNPDCLAADAAESYYDDDPNPDLFPIKLKVFEDGKSLGKFEVFLEISPNFSAVSS